MIRRARVNLPSLVTNIVAGSGFVPVWLATGALLVIVELIASETLSSDSLRRGIDLCIPGVIVLVANVLVGVGKGEDGRLVQAIVICLAWSAVIGLVNGLLVAVGGLNPLIVTLAVGQIVTGVTVGYARTIANESAVPPGLSSWAIDEFLGVSWMFWVGVWLTIGVALLLRYTSVGRRFQVVGANARAAWIAGIHVQRYVVMAYVGAAVLYGVAGVLLAAFIRSPSIDLGDPYLLGPIAAVVIGGASLGGGLASVTSVWVAAFALTLLSQMLRVLGLTTAWQYAVYGVAIAAGMVISGDRIVGVLGGLLQKERFRTLLGSHDGDDGRREVLEEGAASIR
jgi:ribose/xylose/arabinose/galactoside ABC-type transport system permease subunit